MENPNDSEMSDSFGQGPGETINIKITAVDSNKSYSVPVAIGVVWCTDANQDPKNCPIAQKSVTRIDPNNPIRIREVVSPKFDPKTYPYVQAFLILKPINQIDTMTRFSDYHSDYNPIFSQKYLSSTNPTTLILPVQSSNNRSKKPTTPIQSAPTTTPIPTVTIKPKVNDALTIKINLTFPPSITEGQIFLGLYKKNGTVIGNEISLNVKNDPKNPERVHTQNNLPLEEITVRLDPRTISGERTPNRKIVVTKCGVNGKPSDDKESCIIDLSKEPNTSTPEVNFQVDYK